VLLWSLLLSLLFDLAGPAQTFPKRRSAGAPNPVDIVERYITVIGGRTKWSSVSSKITRGSIQLPEARTSGMIEIYEKSPNRLLVKPSSGESAVTEQDSTESRDGGARSTAL
jgi:hypothetical protein